MPDPLMDDLLKRIKRLEQEIDGLIKPEVFNARSHVRARTAVAQSFPNVTWTVVEYEDEVYDTEGEYNTGTFTFTATFTGYYIVSAAIIFAATTTWAPTEEGILAIYIDGVLYTILDRDTDFSTANVFMHLGGAQVIPLTAGEALTIRVFQTSGAALSLHTDSNYNWFTVDRLM